MATRAKDLDDAIDNVAAILKEITRNPKPNYSLDGESYSWSEYFSTLTQRMLDLELARQRADGAFEVRSRGA